MWGQARPHNSILLPQSVGNISFLRQSWQFVWSLTESWVESVESVRELSKTIVDRILSRKYVKLPTFLPCLISPSNIISLESTIDLYRSKYLSRKLSMLKHRTKIKENRNSAKTIWHDILIKNSKRSSPVAFHFREPRSPASNYYF